MRLADFILRHMEAILAEWETFAATHLPAAANMDPTTLRDHAPDILRAISLDLRSAQTSYQQDEKAKGRAPLVRNAPNTAAQTHALLRAQGGFNIVQMAGEYRALRASVLRLWAAAIPHTDTPIPEALQDITRFNEAIDQAMMESVDFFNREVELARNLFLGVLGHDLRSPLDTIQTTANLLGRLRNDEVVSQGAARLIRSGARMKNMLDDLLDYNRTTLHAGIHVAVDEADLGQVCAAEIGDFQSAHGERTIELEVKGDVAGRWDAVRVQQLLSNLLMNSLVHGSPDTPIQVKVTGTQNDVQLAVHNQGPAIPHTTLPYIFEPLKRGMGSEGNSPRGTHLGLGLFIGREIAKAHGGDVRVASNERETVFTVRLPRHLS